MAQIEIGRYSPLIFFQCLVGRRGLNALNRGERGASSYAN